MTYAWDFSAVLRHSDMLIAGLGKTALLTVTALCIALTLGLLLALMRLSALRILNFPAYFYITFFRAAPALVLIIWFYFAFPVLINVQMDAFTAALLAIGLQSSAYMAEVFRGGIKAVGQGQWEAANAIGMNGFDTFRLIVLPQAIRMMVPVFLIRLAELVKATTLAGTIAYGETVYQANELSTLTYRPLETFTLIALIFFALIFGLTSFAKLLEQRLLSAR